MEEKVEIKERGRMKRYDVDMIIRVKHLYITFLCERYTCSFAGCSVDIDEIELKYNLRKEKIEVVKIGEITNFNPCMQHHFQKFSEKYIKERVKEAIEKIADFYDLVYKLYDGDFIVYSSL